MNKRLEEVIRKIFNINHKDIDGNWTSSDIIEWDSIGHLNLILGIEKEFDIKLEIEEMFEVEKLDDITMILKRKKCL